MDALAVDILIIFKRDARQRVGVPVPVGPRARPASPGSACSTTSTSSRCPSFAELDAGARNQAIDKLASRALWWFRWAAVATLALGILILARPEEGRRQRLAASPTATTGSPHPASPSPPASCSASPCSPTCGWSSGRTRRRSSPTPATCWPAAKPTPRPRRPGRRAALGLTPEHHLLVHDAVLHGRHRALLRQRRVRRPRRRQPCHLLG